MVFDASSAMEPYKEEMRKEVLKLNDN